MQNLLEKAKETGSAGDVQGGGKEGFGFCFNFNSGKCRAFEEL